MLKITEQYIPKGNKNRPAHPMSPKYITIHDTGNASKGAGAKNHAIYAGRGVNEVGYHFVVDDKNIYQELICKGWFLPSNTYDCGSFVVN